MGPCAEASRDALGLLLVQLGPHDVALVGEARPDVLEPVRHLQLVVVPFDHVERDPQPVENAVVQVAQADVEAPGAPARSEIDFLSLVVVVLVVVVLVVVVLVVVVLVSSWSSSSWSSSSWSSSPWSSSSWSSSPCAPWNSSANGTP
ncbi:MAG: hypothetical protein J4F37_11510 [Acidobacteria bacterium]|nr:hypothetical protein [Acidobacteriota bacterium]